jgi:maltooligosyltrehalose synthase
VELWGYKIGDAAADLSRGDWSAVVVVPRLLTRLAPDLSAPLGEAVWQDARVLIGELSSTNRWRNVFTGETLQASEWEGQSALRAADVFGHLPVSLLVTDKKASIDAGAKGG